MKYVVHTDENNYITSLELNPNGVEVPDEISYSSDLICYKYVDGKFTFDDDKKTKLEEDAMKRNRIEELKRKLSDTDYIYNSIREGGRTEEYYAEVIENRKAWRKEIQELEEELGI